MGAHKAIQGASIVLYRVGIRGYGFAGSSPRGIAIDSSGNVWVATGEQGGVVELVGAATPVRTPLNTRAALP
jgi:DNA-binding beta-propeller fold protein YncE